MTSKDKVMKLAYIVPGGAGGAPLELFDPNDLVDFVNAEIIAELERVVAELEEPDTRPRKIINDHITKLKAKETQL